MYFFLILSRKNYNLLTNQNIKIHILRSFFGVLAMFFGYKALTQISLSLASTIGFTKIFFGILLSWLILKEKPSMRIFLLVLLGFFGVYFITLPSTISEVNGVFLSLVSAIFVSGGIVTVSHLTKKEPTINILTFHSLISSILVLLIFYDGISFDIEQNFFLLLLLTITALTGQYFNVESYRNESASLVILIGYTRIIFSTILGFLFLNEQVSLTTLFGILIIITTTFFVKKKVSKKS